MTYTSVTLEVMRIKGVAQFTKRTYWVFAWDFPEAREKAAAKAVGEGYEVVRVTNTHDVLL
jgi:hypothetical protein